ncbi:MAG TPA: hypothetical protein VG994_13455 [Steroidobacteraceae bacterium]|nr:hypothetical protein [Steroidobacteraceae bacterium]
MEARDLLRERSRPFELALRIRHPSMDPAAISRELRLEPEHCFKAGEPRSSSSGIAAAAVHAESCWVGTLDPEAWWEHLAAFAMPTQARPAPKERLRDAMMDSIGMALTVTATQFLRTHADFFRRLQNEGGDAGLIVELPAGSALSFTLTPQVARIIAELGIGIDFEFTTD